MKVFLTFREEKESEREKGFGRFSFKRPRSDTICGSLGIYSLIAHGG
jgi:hypothetical protein